MSNNAIPELNEYQYKLLCNVAQSRMPAFMLTMPSDTDTPERRRFLSEKRGEIGYILDAGLITDASQDFAEMIRHNTETSGIVVRVYALTEASALMFKNCEERPIN